MGKQFDPNQGRGRANDGSRPNVRNNESVLEIAQKFVPEISGILDMDGASAEQVKRSVEKIELLVNMHQKDVKTHQIRNIFNLVREVEDLKQLNLLRPKLAYIGARQAGDNGKVIVKVIDLLIVEITSKPEGIRKELLKGLKYVMESIVAYHKFYSKEKD